jgi:nitrogen fixation/metabolism regulation signal transduction histidine kinase
MGLFEIKIVITLVLTAAGIFAVSVVLVRDVLSVATSMARRRSQEVMSELKGAAEFYRELVRTRKALFRERADRYGSRLEEAVGSAEGGAAVERIEEVVDEIAQADEDLGEVVVRQSGGDVLVRKTRSERLEDRRWRIVKIRREVAPKEGGLPLKLEVGFAVDRELGRRYQRLGKLQTEAPHLRRMGQAMRPRYFSLFQKWFAISIVVVTLVGLLLARRMTRRVTRLSQATARFADGDMDVKVPVTSRDELGQLAADFNEMVRRLQRSRAQIEYLQKISAWQEIARRLAHEIKNPLTPIRLAMQQVHDTYKGDDEKFRRVLEDAYEIVKEEVDVLRHMVEEFSAFAKLPSVQPRPENVNTLMEEFLRSLGTQEESSNVSWEPADEGLEVLVDRLLFRRVLYNLVLNGLHAAARSGGEPQVRIRVEPFDRGRHVRWIIEDSGPGVPEGLEERIFDPYFTTKDEGTGLGLAIVKKILLEHEGSIEVTSSPLGGARFVINVPAA